MMVVNLCNDNIILDNPTDYILNLLTYNITMQLLDCQRSMSPLRIMICTSRILTFSNIDYPHNLVIVSKFKYTNF